MSKFDLTKEQELELLMRAKSGDKRAMSIFVGKNQGLVQKIARGLVNYGLPNEDLVQEGNIGLMNAIYNFDHTRNARFSTMAVNYIRTPMYRYIRNNARMIKYPATQHAIKLFYTLPKMVATADQLTDERIAEISNELSVPILEIKLVIPYIYGVDYHITSSSDEDEQPGGITWENLYDHDDDLQNNIIEEEENKLIKECLHECINELPEIQKSVIIGRWLDETGELKSMKEIGADNKVSHQAIGHREKYAFNSLRSKIREKMVRKYGIFM